VWGREWVKHGWATTVDGEGTKEEKEGDRHPPHLRSPLQLFSSGCACGSQELKAEVPVAAV